MEFVTELFHWTIVLLIAAEFGLCAIVYALLIIWDLKE